MTGYNVTVDLEKNRFSFSAPDTFIDPNKGEQSGARTFNYTLMKKSPALQVEVLQVTPDQAWKESDIPIIASNLYSFVSLVIRYKKTAPMKPCREFADLQRTAKLVCACIKEYSDTSAELINNIYDQLDKTPQGGFTAFGLKFGVVPAFQMV